MKTFFRSASFRALAALVFMLAIGFVFNADGAFLKWSTHRDMLRHVSVYGILAAGMTLVIISGGIDLSVGSVLGFGAVLFSTLTMHFAWPTIAAIPACLLAAAICGAASGGLVARFHIQPFVATLAMMVAARGLAKWLSGGRKVASYVQMPDGSFDYVPVPKIFDILTTRLLGGNLALVTLLFLACLALVWFLLRYLRYGRYIFAVGGNEDASFLSGVPVRRTKLLAYSLCGALAGLAGICQAAQEQQGDPEAGMGYELTAIAMVVIGGTSLNGGRGGAILTLLGVLTIGYLEKILSINAVGEAARLVLTGLIIVVAVLFQRGTRRT